MAVGHSPTTRYCVTIAQNGAALCQPRVERRSVRWAWMSNWGCKCPTEPVAGNREPEATARDESIRHIDRIHLCREAVWDRSPRRTAVPNASEPLCMPAWSERVWRPPRSPISDRDEVGSGGGDRGALLILTPGDPHGSAAIGGGRRHEGIDVLAKPVEKSDHPIVAMKPGNAGGAKGVTS